jgi:MoaA/NifB/PqqE/SkfB family radical SAM enzyme
MDRKKFGHIEVPLKRVHVELTNICEFNCAFCPKAEMKRPPGYMDTALAKRIITELKEGEVCEKVTFHVMGEPTLHRDLEEILEHAASVGMNVGFTTNGAGLGGRAGQMLLKHRLYQVDVSLQTPDAESFKLRKAGARGFEEYLEGVLSFFSSYYRAHMAGEGGGGGGTFKFRFLNTFLRNKTIEEKAGPIRVISSTRELRETFRYWAGRIYEMLGVDSGVRAEAYKRIGKLSALGWNVVEVYPGVFFETYVLDDWGHAFGADGVREAWAGYCYGMRDHFSVLWGGDVTLCCVDYDGQTAVGNLNESTLLEVLSSDKVGEIVRGFKRYRLVHPYCRRCLGSRSLAGWLFKPALSVLALRTLKPIFYRNTRLVD